jgi:hypothetical protein
LSTLAWGLATAFHPDSDRLVVQVGHRPNLVVEEADGTYSLDPQLPRFKLIERVRLIVGNYDVRVDGPHQPGDEVLGGAFDVQGVRIARLIA